MCQNIGKQPVSECRLVEVQWFFHTFCATDKPYNTESTATVVERLDVKN